MVNPRGLARDKHSRLTRDVPALFPAAGDSVKTGNISQNDNSCMYLKPGAHYRIFQILKKKKCVRATDITTDLSHFEYLNHRNAHSSWFMSWRRTLRLAFIVNDFRFVIPGLGNSQKLSWSNVTWEQHKHRGGPLSSAGCTWCVLCFVPENKKNKKNVDEVMAEKMELTCPSAEWAGVELYIKFLLVSNRACASYCCKPMLFFISTQVEGRVKLVIIKKQ